MMRSPANKSRKSFTRWPSSLQTAVKQEVSNAVSIVEAKDHEGCAQWLVDGKFRCPFCPTKAFKNDKWFFRDMSNHLDKQHVKPERGTQSAHVCRCVAGQYDASTLSTAAHNIAVRTNLSIQRQTYLQTCAETLRDMLKASPSWPERKEDLEKLSGYQGFDKATTLLLDMADTRYEA